MAKRQKSAVTTSGKRSRSPNSPAPASKKPAKAAKATADVPAATPRAPKRTAKPTGKKLASSRERARTFPPEAYEAAVLFGENLKEARQKIGYSQRDLATLADTPQQYISLIETGQTNVTIMTMTLLAGIVGVRLIDLLRPKGK